MKREYKIPRSLRLPAKLDWILRRESEKTNINQTRIVEIALSQYFAVKNAELRPGETTDTINRALDVNRTAKCSPLLHLKAQNDCNA